MNQFVLTPPDARPAPAVRRVLRRARWETVLLARNGEQLLLTLVLPILILIGLTKTTIVDLGGTEPRIQLVMPGVLALAVISTAFTAQAISTGFDRRYGVLRQLGAGPLGRGGLVAARVLAACAVVAMQTVILTIVGLVLGWSPQGNALAAGAVMLLGVAAFTGLALALAGTVRAEATLALANLIYILFLVGGGLFIAGDALPSFWSTVTHLLPSGALASALRDVLAYGDVPAARDVATLAVWAIGSSAVAARWFKWD